MAKLPNPPPKGAVKPPPPPAPPPRMNTAEIKEAIVMLVPVKLVPDHHDHGKTGVIVAFHVPWRGHTRDLHVSVRWEDGEVSQHRHTRLMRV